MHQPARTRSPEGSGRLHADRSRSSKLGLLAESGEATGILKLQRDAGNAAVSSLLAPPALTPGLSVQRYKSYEHVEAGAAESFIGQEESAYIVKKGETPGAIAAAHKVSQGALMERNKSKVHVWATAGGRDVEGFEAGDTIMIPTDKLAMVAPSRKGPFSAEQKKVTVQGVTMKYGEAMAMADFYGSVEDFMKAPASQIKDLLVLIQKEGKTTEVKEEEWEAASGNRYMLLNRKNIGHFAPPDPSLMPSSTAKLSGVNFKSEWEKYHKLALNEAQKGNREQALAINAFGDHFLTDAFAAGHLFNKEALMAQVTATFTNEEVVKKFASEVAKLVWADSTSAALISKYETHDTKFFAHRAINSANRFASVLEGINENASTKDVLPNAIAAAIHDRINKAGLPVTNARGDSWTVQGDGSLEATGLYIMREAVAQSQVNVLNAAGARSIDLPALYKAVWDFTPAPTKEGKQQIRDAIAELSVPSNRTTVVAVAGIAKLNLQLIMDKTVELKKLRLIK